MLVTFQVATVLSVCHMKDKAGVPLPQQIHVLVQGCGVFLCVFQASIPNLGENSISSDV